MGTKVLLVLSSIVLLLISCSSTTNLSSLGKHGMSYEIMDTTYTKNKVKINYPNINNMKDKNKQTKLNKLLETEALKILDSVDNINTSMDVTYRIMKQSDFLLSIQYLGDTYSEGAAYPINIFYTTNVDMVAERKISLIDLIHVDDNFVGEVKNGEYKPFEEGLNLKDEGVLEGIISTLRKEDLLNQTNTFSYITQDALGISMIVPHALGDHFEMEIKFKDIHRLNLGPLLMNRHPLPLKMYEYAWVSAQDECVCLTNSGDAMYSIYLISLPMRTQKALFTRIWL